MSRSGAVVPKEGVSIPSRPPNLASVPTDVSAGAAAAPDPEPCTATGGIHVAVQNSMVAAALSVTAQRSGWQLRRSAGADCVLLTDHVPSEHEAARVGPIVLVIEPTPFSARRAVDALGALRITSVVRSDEPDDLEAALRCLDQDRSSFPREVLVLARRMPAVNERQASLLGAVLAGQTTAQMAKGLHLSPASVKRELSAVSSLLGVPTRAALFARALELGVRPAPLSA